MFAHGFVLTPLRRPQRGFLFCLKCGRLAMANSHGQAMEKGDQPDVKSTLKYFIPLLVMAVAGCSTAEQMSDTLMTGGDVPQNRAASSDIIPPPMQPPPQKNEFEIVGDYAGKKLVMRVNGREIYSGQRPLEPAGVRWQLRHDIQSYPADLSVSIEGCAGVAALTVPETDEGPLLIFRGCNVEMIAD